MQKNKRIQVAVVGSVTGRCGTSALMGLLQLSGFNVGGAASGLFPANKSNPKGYFEIRGLAKFMHSLRPKCYPSYKVVPPNSAQLTTIRKKYYKQFNRILQKEFPNEKRIALKGACLLVIPFFYELRSLYDIRVIMLRRSNEDQLKSAMRAGLCTDIAVYEKLRDAWLSFEKDLVKQYTFCNYLHVDYEDLICDPLTTMGQIATFLNIISPADSDILKWIDPKLMHKKQGTCE